MSSQSDTRLPEFRGPEQLLDAVTAAADPNNDGAVVRTLINPELANSIVSIHDTHKEQQNTGSAMFSALVSHIPGLKEINHQAIKLWGNISVDSLELCDPLNGVFVADDGGIDPHIDIRPAGITKTADPRFCGPIGMSLGLYARALFGVEKPPIDMFIDRDGTLSAPTLQDYRQAVYDNVYKVRSNTVQGIGDLVIWVAPFTIHAVETEDDNRVALIMEQTQTPVNL